MQVYDYDNLYQLTYVDYNDGNKTWYDYDKLGNRTLMTYNTTDTLYDSNALNEYVHVAGVAYTYDANGNLTYDGQFTYIYDCENRLTEVRQGETALATYKYDFAGRRVARTVAGITTTYLYDGDSLIAEYQATNWKRRYYFGPGIDEPICMMKWPDNSVYYYHYDGLGSVIALSNSSGSTAERYSYNVFGEPNRVSTIGNRFMFTGREYDSETGNYYYRARYYKPSIGRFLQTDPIGYYGGLNLYAYCDNNPLNWIDPWGLCKNKKIKEITDADLLRAGRRFYRRFLRKQRGSGLLWPDWGYADTDFYSQRGQHFLYKGKEYTGEELNYIGVGMAMHHFWLPQAFSPETQIIMATGNNLRYGHLPTGGEIYFTYVGYNLYNQISPRSSSWWWWP
jgi:RHS repeat-associated protein